MKNIMNNNYLHKSRLLARLCILRHPTRWISACYTPFRNSNFVKYYRQTDLTSNESKTNVYGVSPPVPCPLACASGLCNSVCCEVDYALLMPPRCI